jgi:hypothetical protein
MNNVDNLTDIITNAIGDDELKLCNENTYNREIGTYLEESYSFVLKKIFEYKGEQ